MHKEFEKKIRVSGEHLASVLVESMLQSDKVACKSLIEQALSLPLTPSKIFVCVIGKAMNRIGDLWHGGTITIAHEHRASEIANELIALVSEKTPHFSSNGFSAVVACVEGEQHELGAKFFSALLEIEGWHVYYLGSSLPAKDLAEYALVTKTDAVVISILASDHFERVDECLTALNALDEPPVVLIGGSDIIGNDFSGALVANDLISGLTLLESSLGSFSTTESD